MLELNQIYQGDCLEVMKGIDDDSVDSIVTDPPWMFYITGHYDASKWHKPIDYVKPAQYAELFYRVLKQNTSCVIWLRWDVFDLHKREFERVGFKVKNQIVWAKSNHTAGDLDGNLGNQHECAMFAVKGDWVRHSNREVNLWCIPHLFSRKKRDHPTQKPVDLIKRSIQLATPKSNLILDPFLGSGTTAIAAIRTGRNFIGIEQEPEYIDIARKRIADELRQPFLPNVRDKEKPEPIQLRLV